jgi:hypothetical protein
MKFGQRVWRLAGLALLLPAGVFAQVSNVSSGDAAQEESQAQEMPQTEPSGAKDQSGVDQGGMGQMDHHGMMHMLPETFVQEILHHDTSGTSAEPDSTPTPMLMGMKGKWTLMFHADVFVSDVQQSGARGGDKFFSTNWFMGMAQHDAGPGVFTARVMLSLEPATVTDRRYPLLFQQGETAFGLPIVDGQHPHDFIMELALLYDLKLGDQSLLSFYFAPMGDPAMGPTAYPHRASAMENPVGTLGHHQEDSTHIADDVVTIGVAHRFLRLEASGFHGREPDEFRWDIDSGKIDSWSTRLTIQPGKNWSGQYSYGRLASPEALFPTENQERMTASVMYNRPLRAGKLGDGNWASTLLWGRTRTLGTESIFNSYLLESTLRFMTRNYVWTRVENADRSNELLLGEQALPPGFEETRIGRVQAYTFGYAHDFDVIPHLASALGAQITGYGVPDVLQPIYGTHPVGGLVFLRFRPYSGPR